MLLLHVAEARNIDSIGTISQRNVILIPRNTATGTAAWSATVPLLTGSNAITIRVFDAAGNSAWRSLVVVRY